MGRNVISTVSLGDIIYSNGECLPGEGTTKKSYAYPYTVTDIYPHFVLAEFGLRKTSFNFGDLVVLGYEKQSERNQALMASRNMAFVRK